MVDWAIIGCGYVGERLARRLPGRVRAATRTPASAALLREAGLCAEARDLDETGPDAPRFDAADSVVFYLVPPPGTGPADPRLRAFLDAITGKPARFVYMSTTGVYGDAGGQAVDEDSPAAASSDRGRARLDAENETRAWCTARGVPWVVLRVPGIYGPGRLPLDRLRRGDPVLAEPEAGPGNRIHVDDLVSVCIAVATARAARNRVYNVGDGNHASSTAYFNAVARLAALPPPPALPREEAKRRLGPAAWSYLAESRRVDTTRMERELGVELRYRDLEQGIRASL